MWAFIESRLSGEYLSSRYIIQWLAFLCWTTIPGKWYTVDSGWIASQRAPGCQGAGRIHERGQNVYPEGLGHRPNSECRQVSNGESKGAGYIHIRRIHGSL